MSIKKYIIEQFDLHKSMRPEDVVKLCYQASLGAEHLLTDPDGAKYYFNSEFDAVGESEGPLFEKISDDVARINLGAWKARKLPGEWLFNMFYASACPRAEGKTRLVEYLCEAEESLGYVDKGFSNGEWDAFVKSYINEGMPSLHHSTFYRKSERPSYRVVDAGFLSIIPVLEKISFRKSEPVIVSIDGRAASGKSTLAERLAMTIGASIVRVDDFFLPPALRTEQRLDEAGGNIHYERFIAEVLPCLRGDEPFEYGIFDCQKMAICEKRWIIKSKIRIVEGSYSHHPRFGEYADVRVFVTVSPEEQIKRIFARNGEALAETFAEKWIPMEEKYFDTFSIKEKADVVITTE